MAAGCSALSLLERQCWSRKTWRIASRTVSVGQVFSFYDESITKKHFRNVTTHSNKDDPDPRESCESVVSEVITGGELMVSSSIDFPNGVGGTSLVRAKGGLCGSGDISIKS